MTADEERAKDRGRDNNLSYAVMILGLLATLPRINATSQSGLLYPLRWKHGVPTEQEYSEYLAETGSLAFIGFAAFWLALGFQLFRKKL